mgnify:CR=1 FL=1
MGEAARPVTEAQRAEILATNEARGGEGLRSLGVAFRYTEAALDGLYGASESEIARVTFPVRLGPTYDPEMILEHGIVHLLRHRRQIERWRR